MKRRPAQLVRHHRRGTIMPLLALAILAICAAGALVLDRLWVDAAQVQLKAASEASALAAAGRLADDDRLRTPYDASANIEDAIAAADFIARGNGVAGRPVELDLLPGGDVRFGKIVEDPTTGDPVFLETDVDPTSVVVEAQARRERGNPILLFFRGVTGQPTGEAVGYTEATVNNRVIGIRPLPGTTVPCLPLGILETDPTDSLDSTWNRKIELREGEDRFGYDEIGQTLIDQPDGIPEMVLTVDSGESETNPTNMQILDLGTHLVKQPVQTQIAEGIRDYDLSEFGGEFVLETEPIAVRSSAVLVEECVEDLRKQVGKSRLCLLYQDDSKGNALEVGRTYATRLVAIRILMIEQTEAGPLRILVQPSVIATRAAVLSDRADAYENPYVYNLSLTD